MMFKPFISISIRKLAISLLLLVSASASAQLKFFSIQKDSIPLFRGFAVSFDLVGLAMMELSDYGQYEGSLRINLHDEWFPIAELGYTLIEPRVLKAVMYQVPQKRERLILVAIRNDIAPFVEFHWPAPYKRIMTLRDFHRHKAGQYIGIVTLFS